MIEEKTYRKYLEALIKGDKATCSVIIKEKLDANINIKELYTGLFQRSLYKIGELWESNRISVATEHLATSITESLMHMTYPIIFESEHIGKKAVISCVASEFHQIGGKMVADIFELHGWDGYFIGANTPEYELYRMIHDKKPDVLALSLSLYFNLPKLLHLLEQINEWFPGLDIIVGGQAFRWGGREEVEKYEKVNYLSSLDELEEFIANNTKP
ncbi:MAG: cobalamin-dependent protein [Bacteroidales bacterium]|nr:cobalamin-dependent protein [Bacteroidales bacterium]